MQCPCGKKKSHELYKISSKEESSIFLLFGTVWPDSRNKYWLARFHKTSNADKNQTLQYVLYVSTFSILKKICLLLRLPFPTWAKRTLKIKLLYIVVYEATNHILGRRGSLLSCFRTNISDMRRYFLKYLEKSNAVTWKELGIKGPIVEFVRNRHEQMKRRGRAGFLLSDGWEQAHEIMQEVGPLLRAGNKRVNLKFSGGERQR